MSAASVILIEKEKLYDSINESSFQEEDFAAVKKALLRIVNGFLYDEVRRAADDFAQNAFRTYQLIAAKKVMSGGKLSPSILINPFFESEGINHESKEFTESVALAAVAISDLVDTPVFQVLEEYLYSSMSLLDLGVELLFAKRKSPLIKSKAFAQRFAAYSNFSLWLRNNGKIFINMFQYLSQVSTPGDSEYNILQLLSALLRNNIESIRDNSSTTVRTKMIMVEKETERLRTIQKAFEVFGALKFCLQVLGRSFSQAADLPEEFTWKYTPTAIKLGEISRFYS